MSKATFKVYSQYNPHQADVLATEHEGDVHLWSWSFEADDALEGMIAQHKDGWIRKGEGSRRFVVKGGVWYDYILPELTEDWGLKVDLDGIVYEANDILHLA